MKLKLINFIENDVPYRWQYDGFSLRERNLVVGVNASGKSKTLRSIDILASLLSKRTSLSSCTNPLEWKAEFLGDDGETYVYELVINKSAIVREKYSKANGEALLDRPATDVPATIQMERAGNSPEKVEFKIPDSELAAANKMDLIQTPFLVPLIKWGESVFYYRFGSSLGQDFFGLKGPKQITIEQVEHDQNAALPIFSIVRKKYPGVFDAALMGDMRRMGYPIESTDIMAPTMVINSPEGMVGLAVKEEDLDAPTDQMLMSQGMFRAYSILIHANHLLLSNRCGCLLIDDIGEGLDFRRSCVLIDLLTEKSVQGGFQLVMSTNDRFIMNHVPLQDWTVVKRSKGAAKIYNYQNSKEMFDEFEFTGLNNFDFLSTDFLGENESSNTVGERSGN